MTFKAQEVLPAEPVSPSDYKGETCVISSLLYAGPITSGSCVWSGGGIQTLREM